MIGTTEDRPILDGIFIKTILVGFREKTIKIEWRTICVRLLYVFGIRIKHWFNDINFPVKG